MKFYDAYNLELKKPVIVIRKLFTLAIVIKEDIKETIGTITRAKIPKAILAE